MERELTDLERGILEFMLSDPNLPDGDALLVQVPHLRVVDGEPAMPTYLHLPSCRERRRPIVRTGKVPVDAVVVSPTGEATGFILVWTEGGYLTTVEHAWVTDQMPEACPPPERLRRWYPEVKRG